MLSYRKNGFALVLGVAAAVSAGTLSLPAFAGKIISVPSASGAEGYGGWNLDNVTVTVNGGGTFTEATGAYTIGDGTYIADIDDGLATTMAQLKGKDYPVGEPPGLKVINDDFAVKTGKPTNCIMTTSYLEPDYLGTATPVQTICSSGFQTHKRFKVNMLPATVDAAGSESVDLVFNVEADATSRDYQVFQKINNYTGKRLEGFTLEIGFGLGAGFQTVTAAGQNANLSLSISLPDGSWDPDVDIANFAHGLFGPADKHFAEDGFFDDIRAGYTVERNANADSFYSTGTQGSNYAQVPPGSGLNNQFGPWIPSTYLPSGIFFDDDADPTTDDVLMAFWGDTDGLGNYGWMYGDADGFAAVDNATLDSWIANGFYYMADIEDLLNLGLNYIVNVGTVDATWPTWNPGDSTATFTIRVTPTEDTSGIGAPGYVANPATFNYTDAVGYAAIAPNPTFVVGETLNITVGDADLNSTGGVDTVVGGAVVTTPTGESETLDIVELGDDRGVFTATLSTTFGTTAGADDDGTLNVQPGTVVTVTYNDVSEGASRTATTTAAGGTTGVLTVSPSASIGDRIILTVEDPDLNGRPLALDFAQVTVVNDRTGEIEMFTLTENDFDTGVFTDTMLVSDNTSVSADNNAAMLVREGDTLTTTYTDAANDAGQSDTVTATTNVVAAAAAVPTVSGGGGGGGCTMLSSRIDPLLPTIVAGVMGLLAWRKRKQLLN